MRSYVESFITYLLFHLFVENRMNEAYIYAQNQSAHSGLVSQHFLLEKCIATRIEQNLPDRNLLKTLVT